VLLEPAGGCCCWQPRRLLLELELLLVLVLLQLAWELPELLPALMVLQQQAPLCLRAVHDSCVGLLYCTRQAASRAGIPRAHTFLSAAICGCQQRVLTGFAQARQDFIKFCDGLINGSHGCELLEGMYGATMVFACCIQCAHCAYSWLFTHRASRVI
jgi:hypothetical protein